MVNIEPLRIVFFGTPEFAVPTLRALHESRHPVVSVVTQPDRASGRGQKPRPGAVKTFALERGLSLMQPESLRDARVLAELRSQRADLGVVAAYGRILSEVVLGIPRFGMINVHASLLPKYRGAAPIHRAVLAGESETGVTIMRVVKALDAGPMISKVSRGIGPHETSSEVEQSLAALGATALVAAVDDIAAGTSTETPQDERLATYAAKLVRADGIIDWSKPASVIHNQIRGLHPWPHAFSDLEGERTILLRSLVGGAGQSAAPGTIVGANADRLTVQTGDGLLHVLQLQREGRRPVSAREFLAGRRLEAGARFEPSTAR